MKQVLVQQGNVILEDVPAPMIQPGCVLVRVDYSCISIGTEMSGVRSSGKSLLQRAKEKPENVKKGLDMIKAHGIVKTREIINSKLKSGNPTGYSAAGVVVEVGEGVTDIKVGDRVGCAGAQCAFHAEYICVPRNLAVKVPDRLDTKWASTVTLGSIAMQGVRRFAPTLGETVAVIGMGILGQLVSQFLQANGCKVIAMDLDQARVKKALELGATHSISAEGDSDVNQILRLTDGNGVDGVIVTAATPSSQVISTAFNLCRRKGRVVLIGDVGLDMKRADIYAKELDFFISTSYGPGRYDQMYEEKGLEYPIGYVRWTENRNMQAYLQLLADGKVNVESLVESTYPIEEAHSAYERLKSGENKPLMVLLSYPHEKGKKISRIVPNPRVKKARDGVLNIAIAGAGGFAKGMHLPNIRDLDKKYHLRAVMSRSGHNAASTAKQFGADYSTTDYRELLADDNIDVVLITTRHNLHFQMVMDALRAGKHVLVEKPMVMNKNELEEIKAFYDENKDYEKLPVLLTGFNRRFSPFVRRINEMTRNRSNPMIINYRMNAGYIPLDHWVHTEEGGGRNIGEACHIYDLFTYLTNSRVKKIDAHCINPATDYYSSRDNFVMTATFEDGSVANLTYTALGAKDYPKEHMEVYCDGRVFVMEDYKKLSIFGSSAKDLETKTTQKGHREELEALADTIGNGGEWPISLWQQIQAMEMAFTTETPLDR